MNEINKLSFNFDVMEDTGNYRMVVEDHDCLMSRDYYGTKSELNKIKKEWKSGNIWF